MIAILETLKSKTFQEIIEELYNRGISVVLCEANAKVTHKLKKIGIFNVIQEKHVFDTLPETIKSI